jgi:hypothetical protein
MVGLIGQPVGLAVDLAHNNPPKCHDQPINRHLSLSPPHFTTFPHNRTQEEHNINEKG